MAFDPPRDPPHVVRGADQEDPLLVPGASLGRTPHEAAQGDDRDDRRPPQRHRGQHLDRAVLERGAGEDEAPAPDRGGQGDRPEVLGDRVVEAAIGRVVDAEQAADVGPERQHQQEDQLVGDAEGTADGGQQQGLDDGPGDDQPEDVADRQQAAEDEAAVVAAQARRLTAVGPHVRPALAGRERPRRRKGRGPSSASPLPLAHVAARRGARRARGSARSTIQPNLRLPTR